MLCLALVVYLVAYLRVPLHLASLLRLLLPDDIVAEAVGGDFSRVGLLGRIPILFGTGLLLAAAWVLGSLPVRWLSVGVKLGRLEKQLFSLACGLSLLSTLALIAGLLGIGSSPFPYLLLVAAASLALWRTREQAHEHEDAGSVSRSPGLETARDDDFSAHWSWLLLPLGLLILLGAMLPPLDFDVREYHMQVPKEWFQAGKVTFLEHNIYGNMPLGAEILGLPAMAAWPGELGWWWGSLVGKTLVGCFSILTALMLIVLGHRLHSRAAGIAAAVLYLSIPWVGLVSMNGLIEGALGFYLLAAFAALVAWQPGEKNRWPLIVGLLAGAAAACKYPGLLWGVLPAALVIFLYARPRVPGLLLFSLGALVGCGGWYLKNLALVGNPFYPLMDDWFGGSRTAQQVAQWAAAHQVPAFSLADLWNKLLDFAGRDQFQGMLLIPCAVIGISGFRGNRHVRWAIYFSAFFLVSWWLLTHHLPRFWVPLLPFIALLAGNGASTVLAGRPRLLASLLVVSMLMGLLVISSRVFIQSDLHDNRLLVSLAQLRDGPAREGEPDDNPLKLVHRHLNQLLEPGQKLLLVGDATPFDLQVPVLYNTCFDNCLFETMIKDLSLQERRQRLSDAGITHIFIQWSEIRRYLNSYGFTDFVTPALVHGELVAEQQLLKKVPLEVSDEFGELFIIRGQIVGSPD